MWYKILGPIPWIGEYDKTTGQHFLLLEYFYNGDLRNVLQRQTTTWEEKIKIIWYIAEHMKLIHQSGMIHR